MISHTLKTIFEITIFIYFNFDIFYFSFFTPFDFAQGKLFGKLRAGTKKETKNPPSFGFAQDKLHPTPIF